MGFLILIVAKVADIIMLMLLIRVVLSWIAKPGGSLYKVYKLFIAITEPLVAPCRRVTSRMQTGMFDFSVFAAMILVMAIKSVIIGLLSIFS